MWMEIWVFKIIHYLENSLQKCTVWFSAFHNLSNIPGTLLLRSSLAKTLETLEHFLARQTHRRAAGGSMSRLSSTSGFFTLDCCWEFNEPTLNIWGKHFSLTWKFLHVKRIRELWSSTGEPYKRQNLFRQFLKSAMSNPNASNTA